MEEKIQAYIEQITSGLTDEALQALGWYGDDRLISDEELGKLFSKKFMHKEEVPRGDDLCLIYNKEKEELELYSIYMQRVDWSVKCDINNVQSIIDSATECINHCIREEV